MPLQITFETLHFRERPIEATAQQKVWIDLQHEAPKGIACIEAVNKMAAKLRSYFV